MAKDKRAPYKNPTEEKMIDALEELDTFQNEYMTLIPALREALKGNMSTAEILKKFSPLAAARITNIALTDSDSGKALAASKDLLDRTEGKAKESKEITHRLGQMDERDLDNILEQEMKTLNAMSGDEDE